MATEDGLHGSEVSIVGDSAEAAALAAALRALGARPSRGADPGPGALAVVSACHPFDGAGPAAARALAARIGAPCLTLARPPWRPGPGDRWLRARNAVHAARLLRPEWRRVFLAAGRDRIAPFAAIGPRQWFVRARTPPGPLAPERLLRGAQVLDDPGPYAPMAEAALFRRLGIDVLVARNAGGDGARPKILGARAAGLPVVLIEPPAAPPACAHGDVASLVAALRRLAPGASPLA